MEFSDSEFEDMIDSLGMEPGSTVEGVARLCLAQGYESLTPRQRAIYDRHVLPVLPARPAPDAAAEPPEPPDPPERGG